MKNRVSTCSNIPTFAGCSSSSGTDLGNSEWRCGLLPAAIQQLPQDRIVINMNGLCPDIVNQYHLVNVIEHAWFYKDCNLFLPFYWSFGGICRLIEHITTSTVLLLVINHIMSKKLTSSNGQHIFKGVHSLLHFRTFGFSFLDGCPFSFKAFLVTTLLAFRTGAPMCAIGILCHGQTWKMRWLNKDSSR